MIDLKVRSREMNLFLLLMLAAHVASSSVRPSSVDSDDFCSNFCVCDMWYGLRRASCTSRHLYSIQTGVSNRVQALDLSNNSISSLLNYEFKKTGALHLKYLNVSDNAISEIGSFAFLGLSELTVLDLSRNHLYYVLWDTFIESENLRILKLDGNRFGTRVPTLHSNSITELTMSQCQINHLPPETFMGLRQLRLLDLSGNFMIQMNYRILTALPLLHKITLQNNPWSCKDVKELERYLDRRGVAYTPLCPMMFPPKMQQKQKFEKLTDASQSDGIRNNDPKTKRKLNTWITEAPTTKAVEPDISSKITTGSSNFFVALSEISPAWVFAVGFSLGVVTSMIGTYIWLTGTFFCKCPKIRRRDGSEVLDNRSQRVSLLRSSCPGTPPPPYREVILHESSYPLAPPSALL